MEGFRLWRAHKLYALHRRPDSTADDYNPSLYGLGLKNSMSLGLVVLEKSLTWTRMHTHMPQNDDIMSADIKKFPPLNTAALTFWQEMEMEKFNSN